MDPADRPPRHSADQISKWIWLGFPVLFLTALYAAALYDANFWHAYLESEWGLVENAQIVILAIALIYGARILARSEIWPGRWMGWWAALIVAACVYAIGEESSWGQHYFGWQTPEWLLAANDQGEMNLHNVSSWFDQKPRFLLEFGIIVGGIFRPLRLWLRNRGAAAASSSWIWPTLVTLPTSLLVEISRVPDRFYNWGIFDIGPDGVRHSEVQEFFMFYFIFLYLLSLHRRLTQAGSPAPAKTLTDSPAT